VKSEKTMNQNSEKAMKNEKPAKSAFVQKKEQQQQKTHVFAILRPNVLKRVFPPLFDTEVPWV